MIKTVEEIRWEIAQLYARMNDYNADDLLDQIAELRKELIAAI